MSEMGINGFEIWEVCIQEDFNQQSLRIKLLMTRPGPVQRWSFLQLPSSHCHGHHLRYASCLVWQNLDIKHGSPNTLQRLTQRLEYSWFSTPACCERWSRSWLGVAVGNFGGETVGLCKGTAEISSWLTLTAAEPVPAGAAQALAVSTVTSSISFAGHK